MFLSGTVEYFSNDHLPYAIPALLVVLLIVLLPLLFMLYPNGIQVISGICGEREIMPDDYSVSGNNAIVLVFVYGFTIILYSFLGLFADVFNMASEDKD